MQARRKNISEGNAYFSKYSILISESSVDALGKLGGNRKNIWFVSPARPKICFNFSGIFWAEGQAFLKFQSQKCTFDICFSKRVTFFLEWSIK